MSDPCDIEKGLAGIKSQFQQLRQECGKALNGPNSFFDQLRSDLQLDFDGVARQPVDFPYDISDDESDESPPTPARVITRIIQPHFIIDRAPAPPRLPDPVIKPIMNQMGSQSDGPELRSQNTQSEEKFCYVDQATVALTHMQTQTRALHQRHEATNTDSVLPSYESVCISFLESLLNDAPVFMSQGPRPEQVEELLLSFLEQVMRDSRALDAPGAAPADTSKPVKKKRSETAVQHELPKHNMATQSFVSLKAIDPPRALVDIAPRRPGADCMWEITRAAPCFDIKPRESKKLRFGRGDHFQFPPSLRVEAQRPPMLCTATTSPMEGDSPGMRRIDQETDAVPRRRLRIEPISDEVVSVRPQNLPPVAPGSVSADDSGGRPVDSGRQKVPPAARRAPIARPAQPQPQAQPQRAAAPKQPLLQSLVALDIAPLPDLEELSSFNLDSVLREVETSSDGDEYAESCSESLSSSRISALIDVSSVGHYSGSLSGSGSLSSGEIPDSDDLRVSARTRRTAPRGGRSGRPR